MRIKGNSRVFTALVASIATVVFAFEFCTPYMANIILMKIGYWAMVVLVLLTVKIAANSGVHRDVLLWTIENKWPVALAFLLALSLHVRNFHEYRILYDEYVIGKTAMGMHLRSVATSDFIQEASFGMNQRVTSRVDKRPLLFPFLTSIWHDTVGPSMSNVFYLNGLLTWIFYLLVFRIGSFSSVTIGYSMMGLMAGFPLIDMVASSAGYDLFNVTLIGLLFIASVNYMMKRDGDSMNWMVMSSLLLSNCRYESILYVMVPFFLVIMVSIEGRSFHITRFTSISPLLLVIPLMSNRVFYGDEAFFQTDRSDFFGWHHFEKNIGEAFDYLFRLDGYPPNSLILSVLGSVSLLITVLWLIRCFIWKRDFSDIAKVYYVVSLVAVVNTVMALSVFWGAWTESITTRFSIPFQFVMCVSIAVCFGLCVRIPKFVLFGLNYVVFLFFFGVGLMLSCRQYQYLDKPANFGYNWIHSLENSGLNDGDTYVLSEGLSGLGLGGIRGDGVLEHTINTDLFHKVFQSGRYSRVVVADFIASSPIGGELYRDYGHVISPDIILDIIAERRMTFDLNFVIGEVAGVKMKVPVPFVPSVFGTPVIIEPQIGSGAQGVPED